LTICQKQGAKAYLAGFVEKGSKKVVIEPLNLTFWGKSLKVRL